MGEEIGNEVEEKKDEIRNKYLGYNRWLRRSVLATGLIGSLGAFTTGLSLDSIRENPYRSEPVIGVYLRIDSYRDDLVELRDSIKPFVDGGNLYDVYYTQGLREKASDLLKIVELNIGELEEDIEDLKEKEDGNREVISSYEQWSPWSPGLGALIFSGIWGIFVVGGLAFGVGPYLVNRRDKELAALEEGQSAA